MLRFILKTIAFSLSFFLIILTGFFIPNKTGYENMHYSIHDKHHLVDQKEDNRIILLGGSNFSFGIYSPLISDTFKVNVINTSINAGYGLKFIIDDILPHIKKNDIIILSPEYDNYFNNDFYGNEVLIQLIDIYPQGLKLLSLKQFYLHIGDFIRIAVFKWKTYLLSFFKKQTSSNNGIYERESFNKYGDVIAHWNKESESPKSKTITNENFNKDALNYIVKFNNLVEEKNARLFITYPCINRTSYSKSEDAIKHVERLLTKENLTLLGTSLKYSFNDSLYFDTHYHLNKEGQFLRTKLLIDDLKNYIE